MKFSKKGPVGILLAGGRSKRMGNEKGELMIHGKPMMHYPYRILRDLCEQVLVSSGRPLDLPGEYTLIPDEIPGIGPMGGLYSCLKNSKAEINLVLPYDMPGVVPELMQHLMQHAGQYEILIPGLRADQPEPLCGVYKRSVLTAMDEMISRKEYALHVLLTKVRSKLIIIDREWSFFTEKLFFNINRPEDLQQFLSIK